MVYFDNSSSITSYNNNLYFKAEHSEDITSLRTKDENFDVQLGTMFDKHSEDIEILIQNISTVQTEHSGDITSVRTEHKEDIDAVLSDIDNIKSDLILDPVGKWYS